MRKVPKQTIKAVKVPDDITVITIDDLMVDAVVTAVLDPAPRERVAPMMYGESYAQGCPFE